MDLEKREKRLSEEWKRLATKIANAHLPTAPERLFAPAANAKKEDGDRTVATVTVAPEAPSKRSVTTTEYEEILASLRKVKGELFDSEILINHLESAPQSAEDPRLMREYQVRQALQGDADLDRIKRDLRTTEGKLVEATRRIRQAHDPVLQNLTKAKKRLDEEYKEMWKVKEDHYRASFMATAGRPSPVRDPRGEVIKKMALLRDTQQKLEEELKQIQILSRQEAGDSVDIYLTQQALSDVKEMKQQVMRRLEQLKFDANYGTKVDIIHMARVPNRPSANSRPKLMMATPVGVLAALMSLFILLEIRSGRVGHPDELSPRMKAEVFSVPPLPTLRSGQGNRGRGDQVEEFTQRVDHLRVALCGENNDGVARCVMITSAAGGEGKTTLAAQLAGRCANAGLSTLLIDADLRRPRLGQLLDVPEGPGLSDILSGDAEVDSAMVVIGNAGGFHLLPAGTPAPDPSRLLRGRRLGELLGHLRQTFDIVILDTPPVLPVPDALTMGDWVDGAVLAVRRDASRVSLVERANRMLSAKGIPLLGVVVNGVKTSDMGYGGYSGYAGHTSVANDAFAEPATAAATMPARDDEI